MGASGLVRIVGIFLRMTIQIQLNGASHSLGENSSVADLLDQLGMGSKRVAVELNREILPRSEYADKTLNNADRVEIVQAIGGG